MRFCVGILTLLLVVSSCNRAKRIIDKTDIEKKSLPHLYADPLIQEIHDLKDRRDAQGLLPYLIHTNPQYRSQAAFALISVGDSSVQKELMTQFLKDTAIRVQENIALALGQCPKDIPLPEAKALLSHCLSEKGISALLWSFGRRGDHGIESIIDSVQVSRTGSVVQLGALKGWYELRSRGKYSPEIIQKVLELAGQENEQEVREMAAAYLARLLRSKDVDLTAFKDQLIPLIAHEEDPLVKMHLASTLLMINDVLADIEAEIGLRVEQDYRVLSNLIRSNEPLPSGLRNQTMISFLNSDQPHLQVEAARFLKSASSPNAVDTILEFGEGCNFWKARLVLAAAVFEKGDKIAVAKLMEEPWFRHELLNSPNYHVRAGAYQLFVDAPQYADFIFNSQKNEKSPMAATYALQALARMAPNVDKVKRKAIEQALIDAVLSNDGFEVYTSASELIAGDFELDQPGLAEKLKSKVPEWTLPQYFEPSLALQQLILKVEGGAYKELKLQNPYNHPIDWNLVRSIHQDQQMVLHCEKGDIVIALNIEEAPGTVSYIVELAKSGFYDGLDFHRVVPNFVVQGGDPDGNGTGSTAHSLRSEFGWKTFREGTVGIASAGKDTESCQFFITHCATPNLNGRYTIIGHVVHGMDVVHNIQVGDVITRVSFPETTPQ